MRPSSARADIRHAATTSAVTASQIRGTAIKSIVGAAYAAGVRPPSVSLRSLVGDDYGTKLRVTSGRYEAESGLTERRLLLDGALGRR